MTKPYQGKFVKGSRVRVANRAELDRFRREWTLHNPLAEAQLEFAGTVDVVRAVGFYHGGDVLYWLEKAPGAWHEACLDAA